MKRFIALGLLLGASAALPGQTAPAAAKSPNSRMASRIDPAVAAQLTELRKALDAQQQQIGQQQQQIGQQQQQIKQLSDQVQGRDQQIQHLLQKLDDTQTVASAAATKADKQGESVTAFRGDLDDLKQSVTGTVLSLQETQSNLRSAIESPLTLHYKGVAITPGGFLAAETVWRQHALGAGLNTPFNSIPMPGSATDRLSEFFGSGRQSRISMLVNGKLNYAELAGYVEGDFLSAGVTSNNNQSNSYTLRQRQAWGQAALNDGFTFTGGQMWSLVTETKKGLDNRSEALPMTIDPQYNVGFSWERQFGFRVTKRLFDKYWLGASIENAQTLFSASGQAQNFLLGSAGASGGLYNPSSTYSFNSAPDFVFKAAAEPGFGHFEIFGIIRRFRDRVYPNAAVTTPSALGAYNFSTTTAGYGANARVSLLHKHIDVGGHFLAGDGMGRYGSSSLPDVTVNSDGTLAALKSAQGLATLEYHTAKLDLYFNAGAEFVGRHVTLNPLIPVSSGQDPYVGYGDPMANNSGCYSETIPGKPTGGQFPTSSSGFLPGALGSCAAVTRNVIEGTAGFWYRFYKGPKGTVQWGSQYSYFVRNTWSGIAGASALGQPRGNENIVETSFRYYLP
ncbi:MAG: hypothetical protein WCF26_16855 [Candidatus Sulfotelmatobacter sp.]